MGYPTHNYRDFLSPIDCFKRSVQFYTVLLDVSIHAVVLHSIILHAVVVLNAAFVLLNVVVVLHHALT